MLEISWFVATYISIYKLAIGSWLLISLEICRGVSVQLLGWKLLLLKQLRGQFSAPLKLSFHLGADISDSLNECFVYSFWATTSMSWVVNWPWLKFTLCRIEKKRENAKHNSVIAIIRNNAYCKPVAILLFLSWKDLTHFPIAFCGWCSLAFRVFFFCRTIFLAFFLSRSLSPS